MKILVIIWALVSLVTSAMAGEAPIPKMDWASLKNPVLEYPDWSIKDYGIAYKDGTFHLFFSAFYEDNGQVRSHVVELTTTDFKTYSEPILNIDGQEAGWIGMCSPNVTRIGDTYYLTFNSWGDREGRPNRLFYMESKDLINWSPRAPLGHNVTRRVRAIDSALEFDRGRCILFWKEVQKTRCMMSDSIDGVYKLIGDGWPKLYGRDGQEYPWNENYQIIKLHGKWRLLASGKNPSDPERRMMPILYTMKGTGEKDEDWLTWVDGYELKVAREEFNTNHCANSAVILDLHDVDGYYYLLYAGRTENRSFLKRGHNKLGISRSRDLVTWYPAGTVD